MNNEIKCEHLFAKIKKKMYTFSKQLLTFFLSRIKLACNIQVNLGSNPQIQGQYTKSNTF